MHFFLWLSDIPLYVCTTAALSIHLLMDHPCCNFYDLAIINSAGVNIGVQVSFSILVSSGYMPNSGISGSYGSFIPSFFFFFKESPYCLPSWLYQLTFPPAVLEGSLCSTPSPAFIVYWFFDDGHSDCYEVIYHCSLI